MFLLGPHTAPDFAEAVEHQNTEGLGLGDLTSQKAASVFFSVLDSNTNLLGLELQHLKNKTFKKYNKKCIFQYLFPSRNEFPI